jgi:hypothetical protein
VSIAVMLLPGCGGDSIFESHSASSSTTVGQESGYVELGHRPPDWTAKMAGCPHEVRLTSGSSCKLLAGRQALARCPSQVGFDLRASGIGCRRAAGFVNPLGGAAGVSTYEHQSQHLSRPAVARYLPPYAVRGTGWTCWTGFDPAAGYVQYVCWRGTEILSFKFG